MCGRGWWTGGCRRGLMSASRPSLSAAGLGPVWPVVRVSADDRGERRLTGAWNPHTVSTRKSGDRDAGYNGDKCSFLGRVGQALVPLFHVSPRISVSAVWRMEVIHSSMSSLRGLLT